MTFVGKKSVPASLRKDVWQPMATISFPHPPQGLSAFRKLREYRRMHELSIPLEDIRDKTKNDPTALIERKKRARLLMDQKANSVADMAAVLKKQDEAGPVWDKTEEATASVVSAKGAPRGRSRTLINAWLLGKKEAAAESEQVKRSGVEGVTISWRNLFDAEFAESWPKAVVHSALNYSRHTPDDPARQKE